MVERAGQFARRGGIVDIFPAGESSPVRIELFGDDVESLRRFDASTQRSTVERKSAVVAPLYPFTRTAIPDALQRLRAIDVSRVLPHIRQKWLEDIARLEAGLHIDGLAFYAPFMAPETPATLFDYVPANTLVVVDEPEVCLQAVNELRGQMNEIQQELTGRGELPEGMPDPLIPMDRVLDNLGRLQRLELRQRYAQHESTGTTRALDRADAEEQEGRREGNLEIPSTLPGTGV